ncbi:MAG: hypothetical protein AAF533_29225, partial [Acidobacteriota bacterium]
MRRPRPSLVTLALGCLLTTPVLALEWEVHDVAFEPDLGEQATLASRGEGDLALAIAGSSLRFAERVGGDWRFEVVPTGSCHHAHPDLAIDADGEPAIAWEDSNTHEVLLARRQAGTWSIERVSGAWSWDPDVLFDASGNPVVGFARWSESVRCSTVLAERSSEGWSELVLDETDGSVTCQPRMALTLDDTIAATWRCQWTDDVHSGHEPERCTSIHSHAWSNLGRHPDGPLHVLEPSWYVELHERTGPGEYTSHWTRFVPNPYPEAAMMVFPSPTERPLLVRGNSSSFYIVDVSESVTSWTLTETGGALAVGTDGEGLSSVLAHDRADAVLKRLSFDGVELVAEEVLLRNRGQGHRSDLALGPDGTPVLLSRVSDLRLHRLVDGAWTTEVLPDTGDVDGTPSLAIDRAGHALVAYPAQHPDSDRRDLVVASWDGAELTTWRIPEGSQSSPRPSLGLGEDDRPIVIGAHFVPGDGGFNPPRWESAVFSLDASGDWEMGATPLDRVRDFTVTPSGETVVVTSGLTRTYSRAGEPLTHRNLHSSQASVALNSLGQPHVAHVDAGLLVVSHWDGHRWVSRDTGIPMDQRISSV